MITLVALLRGINVSGKNLISMNELKKSFTDAGMMNPVTYIQSGNVVFSTGMSPGSKLNEMLEKQLRETNGINTKVITLSRQNLENTVSGFPFKVEYESRSFIMFLSSAPSKQNADLLSKMDFGNDNISVHKDLVYFACNEGMGKSVLSNNLLEKKLGVWGTTRNLRTVAKLVDMMKLKSLS